MKRIITIAAILLLLAGCRDFSSAAKAHGSEEDQWDMIPCVMIEDTLYITTGYSADNQDSNDFDGTISSEVPGSELPTKHEQSNFGTGYPYRTGDLDGTIEVKSNDKWWIYATEDVRQRLQFPELYEK